MSLVLIVMCSWAQGQTTRWKLRITSPKNRTAVMPGTVVTATISVKGKIPAEGAIAVIGEEPLTGCYVVHAPYTCSFAVASDTPPGVYAITATIGEAESEPIDLDVEREDLPVRVELETPEPFYCWLDSGPRELPLIYATSADGTRVDINHSTRLT